MKRFPIAIVGIGLLLIFVASAATPIQAASILFDEADFSNPLDIDNPYFPLEPGTSFIYQEQRRQINP
jgi:hypothetical protein